MKNSFQVRNILLKKIQKVKTSQITGLYYRLVSLKHKNEILSTSGSLNAGGRYNPPDEFGVLYLGETTEVCKAERIRRQDPRFLVPQVIIGKIKVSCKNVLDLTDSETLKILGIKKEDLLAKEKDGGWDFTWNIARCAHQCGIEAILAPSVTGKGNNLIIFEKHLKNNKIKILSKQKEKIH